MSGDVQPRKRKEKRRKKEDSEEIASNFSSDEHIHVHKDASTGGNICAKILFFLLSFLLLVMVGLVLFEYRGFSDDEALIPVSKWAPTFDGWLDDTAAKHDEHEEVSDSGEHGPAESGEHEDESVEEEEQHGSDEDEIKHTEEEEEEEEEEEGEGEDDEGEEEDRSEEDKLDDMESEEKAHNEDETEEEDEAEEDHVPYRHVHQYSYKQIGKDIDEDISGIHGIDDDDEEGEEESEEQETGRDELDDDLEENEPTYGHESDEDDGDLHEIPGITESDEEDIPGITESTEDEEGDNLEQSGETKAKQEKTVGIPEESNEVESGEDEEDLKKQAPKKEVGDGIKNERTSESMVAEEEDEPEPSGVALKFGVGVALVIVAHMVLVRKWNSDDNIASPDTSNVVRSEPQNETPKVSKLVPQITVEQEIEKESEDIAYAATDYISRRQTLLPEEMVYDSQHKDVEETDSSVPSEEEVDDGQEELIFKQNVYKAENAFKAPQRDERAFSGEKSYKQQSFEELMKKYHELTPEGSESESVEDQEDDEEEEEEEDDGEKELEEDDTDDNIENEDEDSDSDIMKKKILDTKTITHPDAGSKSPGKIEHTVMQAKTGYTGKQLLDEDDFEDEEGDEEGPLQHEEEEEEEEGEEDDEEENAYEDETFNEKFRQYEFSKMRQPERGSEDSGSEKEVPITKSKITKNMGGQSSQVYSKSDITNEDEWNIIQELDAADNDAEEGLNL